MHAETGQWTKWIPPYDPRHLDGTDVVRDEHGRLIETASCSIRCPGCGICCAEYRDVINRDYRGVEEFELNSESIVVPGRLVKMSDGVYYRGADCGPDCPGYGCCCPPFDQRDRPASAEDARRVLLEGDDAMRWEMQESLLVLAHDGSDEAVEILEAFMPRAHTRLEGFVDCALDEGRYFNTVPRNELERQQMIKREVLHQYEERITDAQVEIDEDIQPRLDQFRYELKVLERLRDKAENEPSRDDWQIQVDVQDMLITQEEARLTELQTDIERYETIIAEIESDLEQSDSP